jgi:hypothetical protein
MTITVALTAHCVKLQCLRRKRNIVLSSMKKFRIFQVSIHDDAWMTTCTFLYMFLLH